MDFPGAAGNRRIPALHRHRRRSRTATVELAAAAAFRLAPDYVLASAWIAGALPDPVRRIWIPRSRSLQCSPPDPPSYGRAVGADDGRGAGALATGHARTVRFRPGGQ